MNKSEFIKRLDKDFEVFAKENSQKKFPITITIESKEYGKSVFYTDALFLTANNKKGPFTLEQCHGARGFTLLRLGVQQIESIEKIIKSEEFEPARYIFLSMLEDILKKYKH